MTNKSDTPETDIVIGNVDSITPRPPQEELIYIKYSKMLHHARRLERELNALRAENEEIRKRVEQFRLSGRIDDLADAIQAIHEARSMK